LQTLNNISQFIKAKNPWKNPKDIILVALGIIFILSIIFCPLEPYKNQIKENENDKSWQLDPWWENGGVIRDPIGVDSATENLPSPIGSDSPTEDLQSYYNIYQAPSVLHLRKALNSYLDGTNIGMEGGAVIEKRIIESTLTGLDAFDRMYYKSKFIVLSIEPYNYGGELITIIFQDKPDKIFQAWVYWNQENPGYYDFRGFWQVEITDEAMNELVDSPQLKAAIQDKEHAI